MGRHRSNLPAEVTSFVGRRQELREVKRLLGTTRLLTLTGSGGAGKTKLALRAAAEMARGFAAGDLSGADRPADRRRRLGAPWCPPRGGRSFWPVA